MQKVEGQVPQCPVAGDVTACVISTLLIQKIVFASIKRTDCHLKHSRWFQKTQFLLRDATNSAAYAVVQCLSV